MIAKRLTPFPVNERFIQYVNGCEGRGLKQELRHGARNMFDKRTQISGYVRDDGAAERANESAFCFSHYFQLQMPQIIVREMELGGCCVDER